MENEELLISIVTGHLEKVSPDLAEEFKVRSMSEFLTFNFTIQRLHPSETRAEVSLEEVVRNYERRAPAKTRWEIALARMRVERELEDREDETSSGENMVVVSLCGQKGMYCLDSSNISHLFRFRERGREV